MTPEQHARLSDLFMQAMDLPPNDRGPFLDRECVDDRELRQELDQMLGAHEQGELIEDATVPDVAPRDLGDSLSGQKVSRYRIIERIGEGGMAVVYRGEDTELKRPVALKFLSSVLSHSKQAYDRFLREARTAAAIDHPNVCPIYEINTDGDRPFIAMAYLRGRTVADCLLAGPMEIQTAVDTAIQACLGLEAAHAQGIVHRDVKPSNLMLVRPVTGTGRDVVKVLDFGIASFEREHTLTQPGAALGTISYMSPEQIATEKVDERTDLWSLGVTLYEMLTGRRAFDRDSMRELAAAIAGGEPTPISEIRPEVPRELARVVYWLLRKDPDERWDSAREVADQLEQVDLSPPTGKRTPIAWDKPSPNRKGLMVAAGLFAAGALAFFALGGASPEPTSRAELLAPRAATAYPGKEAFPALSPDGKMLAFSWTGDDDGSFDVYVQPVDGFEPFRLTNYPEGAVDPAWSPDGTRIAFLRERVGYRELRIVSVEGGEEVLVRTIPGEAAGSALDWSPTGDLLAVTADSGVVGIRLADPSAPPIRYSRPDETATHPRFDPSGERLAFVVHGQDGRSGFEVIPVNGDRSAAVRVYSPSELREQVTTAPFAWTADGERLVYSAYRLSPFYALRVTDGTVEELPIPDQMAGSVSIRGDRLVFNSQTEWITNVWALELNAPGEAIRARPVIQSSRRQYSPRFSADGSTIAFTSNRTGASEIWRSNHDGGELEMLTSAGGPHVGSPAPSPDGRKVALDGRLEVDSEDIYIIDGPGAEPRRLTQSPSKDIVPSWSPDGRWVYFCSLRAGAEDIWRIPSEGGEAERVTTGGGFESFPSRDGRYLFYSRLGDPGLVIRLDLETGGETTYPELGTAPDDRFWAPSAEGIYFVDRGSNPGLIQYLDLETRAVRPVHPFKGFEGGPAHMDVSPDGRTVLFVQQDKFSEDIMLVEGLN